MVALFTGRFCREEDDCKRKVFVCERK